MKKKMLCMLLALCMVLGLFAACGGTESASTASEPATVQSAETPASEAPAEAEPEAPAVSAAEEVSVLEEEVSEGFVETPINLPLTEEPVTFSIFTKVPPLMGDHLPPRTENPIYAELEARTGVHLDITEVTTSAYNDNFMLMVAGGDWTDIFCGLRATYPGGLPAALSEEIILDLSEYEEYMPNYMSLISSDENVYRDVTLGDGSIGSFYQIYDEPTGLDSGLLIRADWLDELNMEKPETVDEYYEVLTAMHNEYGAVLCLPKNGVMASQAFVSAYDIAAYFLDIGFYSTLMCYTVENDKLVCGFMEEGFKQYLQLMNKWYEEDLISHDYMSISGISNLLIGEDADSLSDLLNNKISVWGDSVSTVVTYGSHNAVDPDFRAEPVKFPTLEKGDSIHASTYVSTVVESAYSISSTCHNPELLVQWIDYSYTSEGSELFNWGIEDVTFTRNEDGSHQYTDMILNNPEGYTQSQARYVYLGSDESFVVQLEAYHALHNDFQMECFDVWNSNREGDKTASMFLGLTTEEGDALSEVSGDIISYLYESVAKFITGDRDIDTEFDEFLEDMRGLGVDKMTELQQAAYDRWAGIA